MTCHSGPQEEASGFIQEAEMSEGKTYVRAFIGVSTGKVRPDWVDSLGLASLNNSRGLQGVRSVLRCLVLGPELI